MPMPSIPPPAPTVHRWTRTEYRHLVDAGILEKDNRVELIEGEIIHMSPQNTPHAVAVRLVRRVLRPVFPDEDYLVDEQLPLALDPDSEPEPDVSVVQGQPRDFLEDPQQFSSSRWQMPLFNSTGIENKHCMRGTAFRSTGSSI